MPLLVRYILREYLKIFLLCLSILILVYLAIDFFEKIGRFIQQGAAYPLIARYFGLRIPRILSDVTPIAILLSTLITLGILSRHNEIVAMKSHGIRLVYVISPLLGVALLASLGMGFAGLSFVPVTKQRAEFVRAVKIKKNTEQSFYGQSRLWMRDGRRTFINILLVDPLNRLLHDVTLFKVRDDFTLEAAINADRIQYNGGQWVMRNGRIREFSPDGTMTERVFEEEGIALERKPEEFKGLNIDTDKMKFSDLKEYIRRLEKDGYDVGRYRTDLYNKVAFPLVNFIMALIAIPFGLMETRGRGISRGIGISLLIGSAYWILHSFSISMGHTGWMPPLLASGLADFLFLSVGIYLVLGIRQ